MPSHVQHTGGLKICRGFPCYYIGLIIGPLDHKKTRTDLQNVTARGPKDQQMPWEGAWGVHWSVWDTCESSGPTLATRGFTTHPKHQSQAQPHPQHQGLKSRHKYLERLLRPAYHGHKPCPVCLCGQCKTMRKHSLRTSTYSTLLAYTCSNISKMTTPTALCCPACPYACQS